MNSDKPGLSSVVRENLNHHLAEIERRLGGDGIGLYGPIIWGVDVHMRDALEALSKRGDRAIVILDTPGGNVEVVERMVDVLRTLYDEVAFVIPDMAMSAGTIFAMSGDAIYMDYFSRLGPIDPQVVKEDRLVPARSYLIQFDRLVDKDRKGELTTAEYTLLSTFDLAELHQFEQASELSVTLLKKWLATYKFKNWMTTTTTKRSVTPAMRAERAETIARALDDPTRWHSHGRAISRETLESDEIKLKIDDFGADKDLTRSIRKYHHCLSDYMATIEAAIFVQSREYFGGDR